MSSPLLFEPTEEWRGPMNVETRCKRIEKETP